MVFQSDWGKLFKLSTLIYFDLHFSLEVVDSSIVELLGCTSSFYNWKAT